MPLFERLAETLGLDDFDKRHKTAFIVLACAVILIVVLWVVQLRKNITDPLYAGVNPNATQENLAQTNADAELRAKDTDADGLNDWDELNLYNTSPYLADSDSDQTPDKAEVQAGTDPNCPAGQQCTTITEIANDQPNELDSLLTGGITTTVTPATGTTPTTTPSTSSGLTAQEKEALRQIIGTSNDPQALRNFLLQGGADEAYVNGLSDEDLRRVLNELLAQ